MRLLHTCLCPQLPGSLKSFKFNEAQFIIFLSGSHTFYALFPILLLRNIIVLAFTFKIYGSI